MSAVSKTIVARHRLLRGVGMVAVVVVLLQSPIYSAFCNKKAS
jgi:hypothetical protein